MKKFIWKIYLSDFFGFFFRPVVYCLKTELADCDTVLDLGCGPESPLKYCTVNYSVGVDAFAPYLETSKQKKIHNRYLLRKIENLNFHPKSFDAVLLIEVLEHLSENDALATLKKAENWAKKKIIVSSPNGYISQKALDDNPLQKHKSGWTVRDMRRLSFTCRGLGGLKYLRQEVQDDTMGDDLLTSIRFSPKIFWFAVATLSQLVTYFLPSLAFEIFSVKKLRITKT